MSGFWCAQLTHDSKKDEKNTLRWNRSPVPESRQDHSMSFRGALSVCLADFSCEKYCRRIEVGTLDEKHVLVPPRSGVMLTLKRGAKKRSAAFAGSERCEMCHPLSGTDTNISLFPDFVLKILPSYMVTANSSFEFSLHTPSVACLAMFARLICEQAGEESRGVAKLSKGRKQDQSCQDVEARGG